MALTDYLSFAEVREAIGIEDDELSDDTLSLPMYRTELSIALASVGTGGTLDADYRTAAQLDEGSRTADQQMLFDFTRLFAVYTVALAVLPSVPLRAMKGESDEKSDYTRFGGNVHDQVYQRLTTSLERSLQALSALYARIQNSGATRPVLTVMGTVSPSYDPISG